MENIYFKIIVGALLFEFILSTISSLLNMNSMSEDIPKGFENHYDKKKYSLSCFISPSLSY